MGSVESALPARDYGFPVGAEGLKSSLKSMSCISWTSLIGVGTTTSGASSGAFCSELVLLVLVLKSLMPEKNDS